MSNETANSALPVPLREEDVASFSEKVNYGDTAGVKEFLDQYDAGVVDVPVFNGGTALIVAASESYLGMVGVLLEKGAFIDAQDASGYTALAWAASNGKADIARLLLERGARTDLKNNTGETALMLARFWKNEDIVDIFLHLIDVQKQEKENEKRERLGTALAKTRIKKIKGHRPGSPFAATTRRL